MLLEVLMMNILVIVGSARSDGATMMLAKSFIRGARKAGHAVRRVDAADQDIYPCRDCGRCWSKGKPCLINDDFNPLAPYLNVSDLIVIATPLYYSGISASIKLILEKFYAYTLPHSRQKLKMTEAILIATAEDDNAETFNSIISDYEKYCQTFGWRDLSKILVGGVREIGDINEKSELRVAYELGKSLESPVLESN